MALLPGSGVEMEQAAARIRRIARDVESARPAAATLEAITAGEHWQGQAFEAFRALVRRAAVVTAIDNATASFDEAASALEWFGARHTENQATLRWCQQRLAALAPPATAEDQVTHDAVVRDLEVRAEQAWDDHRRSLDRLAAVFDRLDDAPAFAQPPPSTFDRVTGWAGSFVGGVAQGTIELAEGVATLASAAMPWRWPASAAAIWNSREQIIGIVRAFVDDPVGFTVEFGRALVDWDLLRADPARWVGKQIPELLLTLATAGAGRVGSVAARGVRGARGFGLTTRLARDVDLVDGRFLRIFDRPSGRVDAIARVRNSKHRLSGRVAAARVDWTRLRRNSSGGFVNMDSWLARPALRLDSATPLVGNLRQLPGRAHDELRGLAGLGFDQVRRTRHGGFVADLGGRVEPHLLRVATGGLSDTVAVLDGLLAGGPALRTSTQLASAGLLGAGVARRAEKNVHALRAAAVETAHDASPRTEGTGQEVAHGC